MTTMEASDLTAIGQTQSTDTGRQKLFSFIPMTETTSVYGSHFTTARLKNAITELKKKNGLLNDRSCDKVPSQDSMLDGLPPNQNRIAASASSQVTTTNFGPIARGEGRGKSDMCPIPGYFDVDTVADTWLPFSPAACASADAAVVVPTTDDPACIVTPAVPGPTCPTCPTSPTVVLDE